jgi:hypothetical protein
MNGTRSRINPLMKCTSRLSRCSFEITTGHLALRAALIAAASCGRRSSASAPFPVSTSVKVSMTRRPSAFADPLPVCWTDLCWKIPV